MRLAGHQKMPAKQFGYSPAVDLKPHSTAVLFGQAP